MKTHDIGQLAEELHRIAGRIHQIEEAITDLYINHVGDDSVISGHTAGSVTDTLHIARYALSYASIRLKRAK